MKQMFTLYLKNPEREGVYISSMNTCAWLTGTWTQDNVYYFGEVCLVIHNIRWTITKFNHVFSLVLLYENEYKQTYIYI